MEFAVDLLSALRKAERVVVFTGVGGGSAESGIPTFRDALTGLWEQYKAGDLGTGRCSCGSLSHQTVSAA